MEKKRKEQRHQCDSPAFIKFCLDCKRPKCNNCINSMCAEERQAVIAKYEPAVSGGV